ncbi:INCE protein, partial [Ceuthmochares aereus]|nr:INCE protein [Ceuthmochares aereus]
TSSLGSEMGPSDPHSLNSSSLQEKERQRLESLRKKQEAEEERRRKAEEEKKRRQAEMKQRREERLRKALQARERVEQMEEEKKKRMEQKILQSDEKVHLSQGREEKVPEERSKKKLSKKNKEVDSQKQRAPKVGRATPGPCHLVFFPRQEEGELEQQESLQRRRENEVKEKGKRVWELRNLAEQQQVEQGKERYWLVLPWWREPGGCEGDALIWWWDPSRGFGTAWFPAPACKGQSAWISPAFPGKGSSPARLERLPPALIAALWLQKTTSASCSGPSEGTEEPRSPTADENDYGMDLKSDDSTDDENEPRKPVPAWADGAQLNQAIIYQYYHPVNIDQLFGLIPSPKLEDIFGKSKPRYFKRTSSAVWHSPP